MLYENRIIFYEINLIHQKSLIQNSVFFLWCTYGTSKP